MKIIAKSTFAVMIFASSLIAQSGARGLNQKSVDLKVSDLEVEATNTNLLVSKVAYQYKVPISLEVATNDDLLVDKHLRVNVKNGTLRDVLDSVCNQILFYTWDMNDNVIRVFPKSKFRDPLLQSLLEVKIRHFVVAKRTAKQTFRVALTERKELKSLLDGYGVRPSNDIFSSEQVRSLGENFSLELENVPMRSILDYVIKNTETKYWFIRRSGEDLFLNL